MTTKSSKDLDPRTLDIMANAIVGSGSEFVTESQMEVQGGGLAKLRAMGDAPVSSGVEVLPLDNLDKMIQNDGTFKPRYVKQTRNEDGSWDTSKTDAKQAMGYVFLEEADIKTNGKLIVQRGNERLVAMVCRFSDYEARQKERFEQTDNLLNQNNQDAVSGGLFTINRQSVSPFAVHFLSPKFTARIIMANIDASFGLRPKSLNGVKRIGRYYVPSSDSTRLFINSPVKLAGSADSNGIPTVISATASGAILGSVVGVEWETNQSTTYREASTARYVYVADHPEQDFEIQADGVIAVTDIANTADLIFTNAGGTTFGFAGAELDTADIGTGDQLRILQLSALPNNAIGANAILDVRINKHQLTQTAAI